jgi:hypothetical protein
MLCICIHTYCDFNTALQNMPIWIVHSIENQKVGPMKWINLKMWAQTGRLVRTCERWVRTVSNSTDSGFRKYMTSTAYSISECLRVIKFYRHMVEDREEEGPLCMIHIVPSCFPLVGFDFLVPLPFSLRLQRAVLC